ncbi:hypothetical protein DFQ26_002627 [Actinomortierella ambigua]|nr:hypothetical protein DFQ26_002627 [Actinomortierella ambigua]
MGVHNTQYSSINRAGIGEPWNRWIAVMMKSLDQMAIAAYGPLQFQQALETIYNVDSSSDERKTSQEFCEALKSDPAAPLYGSFLAHKDNGQADVVRHFGLSLVENSIRYKWTDGTMDSERKNQIRAAVIDLAAKGVQPAQVEQGFIKEKVARVFVELAKRQWPGEWDDMDVVLRQIYFSDETGRELALLILRSLCEDVCMYQDGIAELRKKDLRAALITITSSENALRQQYPEGVRGHDDEVYLMVGEPENDGWIVRLATGLQELLQKQQGQALSSSDEKSCIAMLRALVSMVDWVLTRSIQEAGVVQLICQALLSDAEKIRLGGMDSVLQAYQKWGSVIIEGDAYVFLQNLVLATVSVGEMQVCAKRNSYIPKELAKFLQVLFAMSSHPSTIISSSVAFFWTALLRHEYLSKSEILHNAIPALLELYSGLLVKNYDRRRESDPVYNHFATIDFDSSQEFKTRALLSFRKAVDVIDLGVTVVPMEGLMWVTSRVSEALQTTLQDSPQAKESDEYLNFDGALTLMEVSVASLKGTMNENTALSDQLVRAMTNLLGALIDYSNPSLVLMDRVVSSFDTFADTLKRNPSQLFPCLDKIFKILDSPLPRNAPVELLELRRRGATTLVKIGRVIPDTLYTIYPEIESVVQRLIQQNIITSTEKLALMNLLLTIGSNARQVVDKRPIFDTVVRPVVAELQTPALQGVVVSPEAFMAFIGVQEMQNLSSLGNSNVDVAAAQELRLTLKQRRLGLSWCLESLLMFAKESLDVKDLAKLELWSTYLPVVLPFILSTVRCMNAIYDPSRWQHLAPEFEILFVLTPEEKERLVKGGSVKSEESNETSASSSTTTAAASENLMTVSALMRRMVMEAKNWLGVVRDLSYRLLAQLAKTGQAFYAIPTLPMLLEQSLLAHVDQLNSRQLKVLISNAIQPIVLGCPEPLLPGVLGSWVAILIQYLDTRLCKAWSLATDEGLQIDENEDPTEMDVSDVIVQEMMLRELTRAVTEFIYALFDTRKVMLAKTTSGVTGSNSPSTPSNTPVSATTGNLQQQQHLPTFTQFSALSRFLLSQETTARPSIVLARHLLTFKDTRSCIRATGVAQSIHTILLAGDPETRAMTVACATELLEAGLMALSDSYHAEGQDKIIQMIIEIYVDVRKVDECPRIVFQQRLGAQPEQLEAFERDLSEATSKSKEQAIVRNYLQGCIAVAKSEWFRQKEQKTDQPSSRRIVGEYMKPGANVLDSAQHEDIGEGLASLFDE